MNDRLKLEIGALNVKLQPHSTERYIQLFQSAAASERVVKQWGDRSAMIGSLHHLEKGNPEQGLYGKIYSFFQLDPNEDWLNTRTKQAAEEGELEEIRIPEHLKPSFRQYNYVFFPASHRVFFETQNEKGLSLGPNAARGVFERLFSATELFEKFGLAEVIVEPNQDALETIFSMYRLDNLELFITRPNPGDAGGESEREFLERLEEQNARSHYEEIKSIKGENLEPNEDTRARAEIAKSNGYVSGRGRDAEGEVKYDSTKEHPLRESVYYDDNQSPTSAFLNAAGRLLQQLL